MKLPGAMMEEIEEAAQIAAENFVDDDEMLTIKEASVKMEVSEQTVTLWIGSHRIPSEKVGGRRYIRMSVAEHVKELREAHGRGWTEHASWGVVANDPEDAAPDTESSAVINLSDEEWGRFWGFMRRAKGLYDKGNASGAADVVFAAADEFELI